MTAQTAAPARPSATSRRKAVLRSLASGVAVLTARSGDVLHGTTVSTLTSVSREPLIIGVCLRPGSMLADLARTEGRFVANVLSGEQRSLARWFADSARPAGSAQFEGVDWTPGAKCVGGAPLLDGAVAQLSCRLSSCVPVGDHEVLLGFVTEATAHGGAPLLSYDGALYAPTLHGPTRPSLSEGAARAAVDAPLPSIAPGEEGNQ